jgi:hypothetical protein
LGLLDWILLTEDGSTKHGQLRPLNLFLLLPHLIHGEVLPMLDWCWKKVLKKQNSLSLESMASQPYLDDEIWV